MGVLEEEIDRLKADNVALLEANTALKVHRNKHCLLSHADSLSETIGDRRKESQDSRAGDAKSQHQGGSSISEHALGVVKSAFYLEFIELLPSILSDVATAAAAAAAVSASSL